MAPTEKMPARGPVKANSKKTSTTGVIGSCVTKTLKAKAAKSTINSSTPSVKSASLSSQAVTPTFQADQAAATSYGVPYTDEETARIIKLHDVERIPWREITRHFPGRTLNGLRSRYKLANNPDLYKEFGSPDGAKYPMLRESQAKAYVNELASWERGRGWENWGAWYGEALELLAERLSHKKVNRLAREYYNATRKSHDDYKCLQVITNFACELLQRGEDRQTDEEMVEEGEEGEKDDESVSMDESDGEE